MMWVGVALVICIVVGIVGRSSRLRRLGWLGAAICTAILGVVAWGYYYDAHALPGMSEKRVEVLIRLRTTKICLDMETHPERWRDSGLKSPCTGYGADELEEQIADLEGALEDWDKVIRERIALMKNRESSQFWFLQKEFGGSF
jgi:hypothetical protein